jgi:uncharacterized protein DUF6152
MRRMIFAVVGILFLAASSVRAHHGYAAFFKPTERTVAVEGDLESLLYASPHVVMQIRAADSTLYTVSWQAPGWVQRAAGVTRTTFKIGDHLLVIGAPSRDPASHEVTLVREVQRPRDGWSWRSNAPFVQPSR